MRLQNPYYAAATRYPRGTEGEQNISMPRQPMTLPRELLYHFQPVPQEQRPPAYYAEGTTRVLSYFVKKYHKSGVGFRTMCSPRKCEFAHYFVSDVKHSSKYPKCGLAEVQTLF